MNSLRLLRRSFSTKVAVDEQCLPIKPTWSIQTLLNTTCEPITDKEFQHLLNLSRLHIKEDAKDKLKQEINTLTQFTENMKLLEKTDVKPLTHIWKETTSQILRPDQVETTVEKRGRELLKHASKKSGNFYTVKGSIPSSE